MTDQGTEYVNAIMNELCNELNVKHEKSTPYHHETLGTIERNHRVFNEYLRSYLSDESDWEEYLSYFAFCYNTTPHSSFDCKYSPFELVFGRKVLLPGYTRSGTIDPIYNVDNFAKESKYRLQMTAQWARQLLINNKNTSKIAYDARIRPLLVQVDDYVMVRDETRHKHGSIYRGPFVVIQIDDQNIVIKDEKTNKIKTVHKNNVNRFNAKDPIDMNKPNQ